MSPAVADQDQDFEKEALSLLKLGNLRVASDASSANETDSGFNSFANSPQSIDSNPLPSAHHGINPGVLAADASSSSDDLFASLFNMDLDDDFSSYPPLLLPSTFGSSYPPPMPSTFDSNNSFPPPSPSNFSLVGLDLSRMPGGSSSRDMSSVPPPSFSSHPHSSRGKTRSPVPFAFRGGAPCIVPPPLVTGHVISLNSDDKSDNPTGFKYQQQLYCKVHTSDSSHPSQHSAATYSHASDPGSKPTPALSTPPTSVHDNMSSSAASGSRRSAAKGKHRQVSPVVSANEKLVMQADDLITKGMDMAAKLHDERTHRRDAHYQDKEAEQNYQQWLVQFNADHEKSMAQLKLKQLERELELERLRQSGN